MKRTAILTAAAACAILFAFALAGCGEESEQPSESGALWQYEYAGVEHAYLEAISDYLNEYNAENLEQKDGMIPCFTSIEVDNDDLSDIKMWGIFDIYNYSLEDGTLTEENGTRLMGMFRMSQEEDGAPCTINDAVFVDEGDTEAIENLCEGHELAIKGLSDPVVTMESRRWYVSEFVKAAGLDASRYQTADGEVVELEHGTVESPEWVPELPEAAETDCIIVIDITAGTNAVLTMHEKNADGVWEQTVDEAAFIGKNGPYKTKEGDLKTPLGSFRINKALGILDDPGCIMEYTKVNENHYWDEDSNSDRYNTLVNTDDYTAFDPEQSERIMDYPDAYQYVLNVSYNEERIPGKGSAIFLHCYRNQRTYTGGCISIPIEAMEYVMQHVDENTRVILRMRGE